MANHVPSGPGTLQLLSLTYQGTLPSGSLGGGPLAFTGVSVVGGGVSPDGSAWGVRFAFDVPGSLGSFNQDQVEYVLAQWLSITVQAQAAATGQHPGAVASLVSVIRVWQWGTADGSGQATWTDGNWNWEAGMAWAASSGDAGSGAEGQSEAAQ